MDEIRKYAKLRLYVGYVFLLIVMLLAEPTKQSGLAFLIVGTICFTFGMIIRMLSAGTIVKAEKLVTGGIYQMTRNPLYLGSLFLGLGLTMMSANAWLILLYFILFLPIYNKMITIEENFLHSAFGKDFEEYQKKVPRLFPVPGAPPGLLVNFSFEKFHKNRELSGALYSLLIAIILWLKYIYSIPSVF